MIVKMYAVRDLKVDEFNQPYTLANDVVAKRVLAMAVNDAKASLMTQYPEDYDLFCIGEYDTINASIKPCLPVFVCSAVSLVVDNPSVSEDKRAPRPNASA